MPDPSDLRPEDRAAFEAVLRLALSTPEIHDVLRADPTGLVARRLRVRALADADGIAGAARSEYREYRACLALGTSTAEAEADTPRRPAEAGPLPLLVVLTPSLAASSAAVVLVLAHLLQLADVRGTLPGSLTAVGWTLALVAATSALIALAARLRTAIRGRDGAGHRARVEQAGLDWRQALLHRGMLPHLRRCLREDPSLRPPPPPNTRATPGPTPPGPTQRTGPACSD